MTDFFDLDFETQYQHMLTAAEQAKKDWGLKDSDLRLLKHRENAVFEAQTASGERCVLRVHRLGNHSVKEMESEHAWTQALADVGIASPAPVPALDGRTVITYPVYGDQPFLVDALTWAEGEQLGNIENVSDISSEDIVAIFEKLGELQARLHNHSQEWTPPKDFLRFRWDIDGLFGDEPNWGPFWELDALSTEQRETALAVARKLEVDLKDFGFGPDRFGLIHADFLPENILVDGKKINIIDFDDGGYGWFMFDIATTLIFHWPEDHYQAVQDGFLRGYRTQRDLPAEHLAMLPAFLAARGTTYLGWLHTRRNTDTAKEMTGPMIEITDALFASYLDGK